MERVITIIIALGIVVFNGYLFIPLMYGAFYILYKAPDETAPFNLSNEAFADIASGVCLLLLLISWIISCYLIFKGRRFKQLIAPAVCSIAILAILLGTQPRYKMGSSSLIPKDGCYYWKEERRYEDRTEHWRWKRNLNEVDSPWVLDTFSFSRG